MGATFLVFGAGTLVYRWYKRRDDDSDDDDSDDDDDDQLDPKENHSLIKKVSFS